RPRLLRPPHGADAGASDGAHPPEAGTEAGHGGAAMRAMRSRVRIADCGWVAIPILAASLPAQTAISNQQSAVVVIRNATIVPVTGARIPNGTIVLRGGRVEA